MSVAHGGSQTLNVDHCHTGFGIGIVGTAPAHGSVSIANFPSSITYTHVGGANVATSDFFSVSDEDGNWMSVSVTIAASTSAISIEPSTLPAMTAGTAFSQQLSATGGTAPYTYSITGGALPPGLSMTSAGLISGTPTQRGNANFTVGVVDAVSDTGSRGYSVSVAGGTLAVSPNPPPNGFVGLAYSQSFSASGGVAPYNLQWEADPSKPLPPGLSFSGTTLSGTPTTIGNYTFGIRVTDSSTGTGTWFQVVDVSMTVSAPPTITVAPTTLPGATVGAAYSQTVTGGGGTAPYTFAVAAGALPTGLALAPATGVLSGTPRAGGSFNFTITVTDADGLSGSRAYTLTMSAPTIALAPATLPAASTASAYSETITASGGTAPYSYAISAGALPAGLTLASDGTLSGTATAGGSFNFTVTATDSSTGSGPYAGSQAYAFTVAAPTVTLAPATLPPATLGSAYSETITASGGTAPYSYAVSSGVLPAGLTLASDGTLSGTATTGGVFNFTVTAADSSTGSGPYVGSQAYAFTVAAPTVTVAPATLPSATVGSAYSETIAASGGTAPYSFAVTAGALPVGLTLASDGSLSGTATAGGSFNFTVTATDSSTGSGPYAGSQAYAFTVAAPTVALAPAMLPSAGIATAYSETITASGGTAPYSYAISAGALPAGLTLAGDGTLSGTATAGGSFNFTVTATDSSTGSGPFTGSQAYAFTVAAPTVTVAPATLPSATVGSAYSETITASGGTAPYSYAVTAGVLPSGLTLASDGSLSGTATAGGSFNFTVTATDSSTGSGPFTGSQAYAFTVDAPTVPLAPATLPSAGIATAYSEMISASGGTAPYSYAVTAGALPSGLTLASDGTLSGIAIAGGSFNFTVTATDSSTGSGPFTGSQAYAFTVDAPTVTVAPTTLPDGSLDVAYSQAVTASGGTAPYSYAVTDGALPAGLNLAANGTLSGTPTALGLFSFTVTATDSSGGSGPFAGAQTYSVMITELPPIANPVSATVAYGSGANAITLDIEGGAPASVTVSAPGSGVAIAAGSSVTYQPDAGYAGPDSFTYTATNTAGTSAPATVSIIVSAPMISVDAVNPLTAPAGSAYTQTFTWSGGAAPYSGYTVTGLPAGLAITATDTASVTLSGTPTEAGSFALVATATDSSTGTGPFTQAGNFTLDVTAAAMTLAPASLAAATVATAYSQPITASGGTAPYTFAITAGALPAGLTLDADGTLSGTPTAAGSFAFDVTVTDAMGSTVTQSFELFVAGTPLMIPSSGPLGIGLMILLLLVVGMRARKNHATATAPARPG